MTELHNDHAQQANNEGAYIHMEDVDAALRRIEWATRDQIGVAFPDLLYIIIRERERLGLPEEVRA